MSTAIWGLLGLAFLVLAVILAAQGERHEAFHAGTSFALTAYIVALKVRAAS